MHALPIWDDKNDKIICSTPLKTMSKQNIHDVLDTIDISMKINALKKALSQYSSVGNQMKKLKYYQLKKDLELITQSNLNSSISINEYVNEQEELPF